VLSHARFIDFEEIMSFAHWLTVAAFASLPYAAVAQQNNHQPDPTDANTPVPAAPYESAFKNYQTAADEQESPDKTWRAANEEMAKLGGHSGHIKGEASSASTEAAPVDRIQHH
jgi:hypothetical protein